MLNLLSLKAVVWDVDRKGFYSPQRKDFVWPKGLIVAHCNRCSQVPLEDIAKGIKPVFNRNCTCGIYSSPNPQALIEYSQANNACYVLLELPGWSHIWSAPDDIRPKAHVLRSWGAQIVGVVGSGTPGQPLHLSPARFFSASKGAEFYEVDMLPWKMVKVMIKASWKQWSAVVKNPYADEEK